MTREDIVKIFSKIPVIVFISIFYLIFALIFALGNRYQINPDGVAYLRFARYLSEGHFFNSITSYWSPLIIWCFAGLTFFNIDGLIIARIVMALCGLFFLWVVWFFSNRFDLSYAFKILAGLIAALTIASWTAEVISPDILLAACATLYFYLVTDKDLAGSKQKAFFCGVAAGVAYLAKAYFMPFFLIHYPLTIVIRKLTLSREVRFSFEKIIKTLLFGMFGFFLLSAVWISLLTVKYHKLTICSSGKISHALGNSNYNSLVHPAYIGLHEPKPYAIHNWEDPSEMEYKYWTPFQSVKYFKQQVKICLNTAKKVALLFDVVNISILILLLFLFFTNRFKPEKAFLYLWSFITVIIYISGYIFVGGCEQRYFWSILIIFLLMAFHLLSDLKVALKCPLDIFIILLFVLSFSALPIYSFGVASYKALFVKQINFPYEVAKRLGADTGPFATIGNKHMGLYVGYYLNKKFYGSPVSFEVKGVLAEMKKAEIKTLIVFSKLNEMLLLRELLESDKFEHRLHIDGENLDWNQDVDVLFLKEA